LDRRRVSGAMSIVDLCCERELRVELPDCEFAPRQRAPLIAIERHSPNEHGLVQGRSGKELAAPAPHACHIDLRRRDPPRQLEALRGGIGACNCARQGSHLFRQGGIKPRRPAQAVPERVARGARLALGRLRTPAGAAIGPTGCAPRFADHSFFLPACDELRSNVHVLF
jgi:hypothetical protein